MMDFWRSAIRQQFRAAIEACPKSVWSGQGRGALWYLAFHVRFHPPPPFGLTELEPEVVPPKRVYRKDELLGYLEHCRKKLDTVTATGMCGNGLVPEAAQHFRSCQIFDRVPYTVPAFG